MHGLYSDPWGRKPESVKSYCQEHGLDFFRYELIGHGSDSDHYEQSDMNIWKAQALEVIDEIVSGDVLLIGMSVSGWLALICGVERPTRVKGIVGISAAPDFTVMFEDEYLTDAQRDDLEKHGRTEVATKDFTYIFTQRLLDTGRENRMLDKEIPLNCPVHLLQGQKDACYPWRKTLAIAERITRDDVTVKLLKNASHRMQQPEDIAEMFRSLDALAAEYQS